MWWNWCGVWVVGDACLSFRNDWSQIILAATVVVLISPLFRQWDLRVHKRYRGWSDGETRDNAVDHSRDGPD